MIADTRLYLVLPARLDPAALAAQLPAILAAGDIACVRLPDQGSLPANQAAITTLRPLVQHQDIAFVLEADDASLAKQNDCDGVHVLGPIKSLRTVRAALKEGIVGFAAGTSRHEAMEAGELDADYVEFADPALAGWWVELFETPCVATVETVEDIAEACAAGVDFVGLNAWAWTHAEGPVAAVTAAQAIIAQTPKASPAA